jgi:hypothetical protein
MQMNRAFGLILMALVGGSAAAGPQADTAPDPAGVDLAAVSRTQPSALPEAGNEPMSLSRDEQEPVVRTFTIEGEDRVSISFDRPGIALDLDPRGAPGLGWDNSWDKVDVLPAVTARTAMDPASFTGRPWLREYAQDNVVTFSPQAPEMASWKLTVVDSRGKPAVVRQGEGAPPASLAWDGRRDDGQAAWPGLIYSFVMETVDPAGNPRTFSGRGFGLPAYRLRGQTEDLLVFSGSEVTGPDLVTAAGDLPSKPLIIETASWLNQAPGGTAPIEIRATARNHGQAQNLARLVTQALQGQVCGAPDRIATVIQVVEDAPDQGVIEIASLPGS